MRQLFSRKAKGAAVIAALFSVTSYGQEVVSPGNRASPHQPPGWFARMARNVELVPEIDSFMVGVVDRPIWHGKPVKTGLLYPCKPEKNEQGVLKWQFCEM